MISWALSEFCRSYSAKGDNESKSW